MSSWKVSKERITLFPHPNAEKLELGKVGAYQVVVQKGLYHDGDEVVFVPEKSILKDALRERFASYLVGPQKDRVKAIALRGELSCGIILSPEVVEQQTGEPLAALPEGEDLSERMDIGKYEPPIPLSLAGEVAALPEDLRYGQHDCEQFGVYADQLQPGEDVVITEKLHGSQAIYYLHLPTGERFVTSKGFLGRGLCLVENEKNAYWQNTAAIWSMIERSVGSGLIPPDASVQVFGELVPCQGGAWTYGVAGGTTVKVFDVRVNGISVPYDKLAPEWGAAWVPVIHRGPFDVERARSLREGMEQVSGKQLHIREGVVVRPYVDRRASDGRRLALKLINPKYKETGEEIS